MSGGAQAVVAALKAFSSEDEERAKLLIELLAPIAVINLWQVEIMADLARVMLHVERKLDEQEMDNRVLQ